MTKEPRHWRDATDEVQAHFAFEALQELGPVVAFTAWCSTEIDAKARATGRPLAWLRKRLKEALDDELGPVEWSANLEEEHRDGKLRLHFHGAGAFGSLTRHRRKGIRKAMRRALGAWDGPAARYQTKLRIARDAGWASYCAKRSWLALPGIRRLVAAARPGSMFRLSFDGDLLTMTNGVRARAKELHQQARKIVVEARQRAAAHEAAETAPEPAKPVSEPRKPTPPTWALWIGKPIRSLALPTWVEQFRPPAVARSRGPPWPNVIASKSLLTEMQILRLCLIEDSSSVIDPSSVKKSRHANAPTLGEYDALTASRDRRPSRGLVGRSQDHRTLCLRGAGHHHGQTPKVRPVHSLAPGAREPSRMAHSDEDQHPRDRGLIWNVPDCVPR